MHCLLVAATAAEIHPFTEHLAQTDKLTHVELDLDILITGVGSMATTFHLTRYLAHKQPDIVIQAGVAGSFDPDTQPGSVFLVQKDCLADLGVQEKEGFQSVLDMGIAGPNDAPYTRGLLVNPYKELMKRTRLKKVKGITVNEITTSKRRIAEYIDKYDPLLESMEGAALHYVCLQQAVPFIQLRAVSNRVGERNKKKWNLPLAIENLNKELVRLLESL